MSESLLLNDFRIVRFLWNEMKLILKFKMPKRLMELKVHYVGSKTLGLPSNLHEDF